MVAFKGGGEDQMANLIAESAMMWLHIRPEYKPLAEFLWHELDSAVSDVRMLMFRRMSTATMTPDRGDPEALVQALNKLHSTAAQAMYIYLKVQDPSQIMGPAEKVAEVRRRLSEDALS